MSKGEDRAKGEQGRAEEGEPQGGGGVPIACRTIRRLTIDQDASLALPSPYLAF